VRIGIDAGCWSNQRGYGRFTRELLTSLLEIDKDNEYVFFIDRETRAVHDLPARASCIELDISESPGNAASASGHRSFKDIWKASKTVAKENVDILFYPSVYTYYPVFSGAKKVVVIHDVIAEKYPDLVFAKKKYQLFWNLKVWMAIKQADMIVTVSEFSRDGIAEHFKLPREHIKVVTEAADPIFTIVDDNHSLSQVLAGYDLDISTRFILYVGGIAPHKNLSSLVMAYSKLIQNDRFNDVKLVLVGDYERDVFLIDEKIKRQMDHMNVRNNVLLAGYVPDSELVYLYNAATVFVLPSFNEGFGLPAVESMACGTPVIGSNTTSLPEVVSNAGLFFSPDDHGELLDKLISVIDNDKLRRELSERSLQRAAEFSWRNSALKMLHLFTELEKNGAAA
jgi:glycosyltransferase involved in cell wall biosynthesis